MLSFPTPIIIQNTPNCLNEPWHPSIVYTPEKFGFHSWWMVQSPFVQHNINPYTARYELPCIHFSDDGIIWHPIKNNPIDDLSENDIYQQNFYSDPHLVFINQRLECYYRYTILNNGDYANARTILYKKVSFDGVIWSDKKIIFDLFKREDIDKWGRHVISPAIIWEDNKYLCWYVDSPSSSTRRNLRFIESTDGTNWSYSQICHLPQGIRPWHIDIKKHNDEFILLCFQMDPHVLYMLNSEDGIHFKNETAILKPSTQKLSFYSEWIYRACMVFIADTMRIYFSANSCQKSYIGLIQTKDFVHFNFIKGENTIVYFILAFYRRLKIWINIQLKKKLYHE